MQTGRKVKPVELSPRWSANDLADEGTSQVEPFLLGVGGWEAYLVKARELTALWKLVSFKDVKTVLEMLSLTVQLK